MAKMGRPKLLDSEPNTLATFEALMGIAFVTEEPICSIFGVSISTLQRWVKKNYGTTFDRLKEQKQKHLKLKLAGKQYELAMKGSVPLLIWLGKQWLGQSDKQESSNNDKVTIVIDKDDAKL